MMSVPKRMHTTQPRGNLLDHSSGVGPLDVSIVKYVVYDSVSADHRSHSSPSDCCLDCC